MAYSLYFQAYVKRELCWMVTATLRYVEHVALDRTIDKQNSIFEFFVSPDLEEEFLQIMQSFKEEGIIWDLQQLPNRLQ